MKQERTDTSMAIWLFLLNEGGWWTSDAIGRALGVADVNGFLFHMAQRGSIRKQEGKPHRYSVDIDCKVARLVSLRDLMKHGLMQLAKEAEVMP